MSVGRASSTVVPRAGVDLAHGNDRRIAAQEHPARAPVGVGIGDELADLLDFQARRAHRVVGVAFRAGVIGVDAVNSRRHLW